MSADLEQLLRDTMKSRAGMVTTGPTWTAPPADELTVRRTRARRIAPLAAAAAVAAIAVTLAVLPSHETRPANRPTPVPTPSPTSSPSPSPVAIRSSCAITLPAAWRSAMTGSLVDLGGPYDYPMSVATDGTVVAAHDGGPQPGAPRTVVLIDPDGSRHTVYSVADPDHYDVQSAQLSGRWLVVAEKIDGRPARDTEPGNSPLPNVHRLVVIDRRTGHQRVLVTTRADMTGTYVEYATVMGGRVFWTQQPKFGAAATTIYSEGLGTFDKRVEYSGRTRNLLFSDFTIHDDEGHVYARAPLPAVVSKAVDGDDVGVRSDGTTYAWMRSDRVIGWWKPGLAAPVYLKVPSGTVDFDGGGGGAIVVSGNYVLDYDFAPHVIDMRTGAIAPVSGSTIFGGHARGQFGVGEGGGVVIGAAYFGTGHFVNHYWQDMSTGLLRLDTTRLPQLGC